MLLILAAALAPWIAPQNPYDLLQIDVLDARLTPGSMNGLDTFHYWLGTDGQAATCCRAFSTACASAWWWAWARR